MTEPELYPGQAAVQVCLLLAAFVSVPFLLFPKPLISYYAHKRAMRAAGASNYTMMQTDAAHLPSPIAPAAGGGVGGGGGHGGGQEDEEEYSFTDEFVHQVGLLPCACPSLSVSLALSLSLPLPESPL
jgi:V-type H+-transporting ATPase subunit a